MEKDGGMYNSDPVHSFHVDKSVVGEKYLFDAWRETVREVYDVNLFQEQKKTDESAQAWLVDSVIFSEVVFSGQSFHHGAHHAKNAHYLSLQTYVSGGCQGLFDDVSFRIEPEDVYIFDFSRVFQSSAKTSEVIGLVIPYDTVGYDPARHPPVFKFPAGSAVTTYLRNAFLALHRQLPSITRDEASAMAEGFCGLLRSLLSLERPEEALASWTPAERTLAMRSYLDRHLMDPDLSVGKFCEVFNVSQATVYRTFAENGGLAHHVMQRRLDRAFFQLVSTTPGHGRVSEIAYKVGFEDPLHFSRLFSKRFGCPPSMVSSAAPRHDAAGLSSQTGSVTKFGEWIKSISA